MSQINFVGDIALFKRFEEIEVDPFKAISLPPSDYNIGNFEFIIPEKASKNFFDVSDNYKVSSSFFKSLKLEKFNAYSLANNHSMDYGLKGVKEVVAVLDQKKIKSFGFGSKVFNTLEFSVKNISFAVISFVKQGRWSKGDQNLEGPDGYDVDSIISQIKSLKQKVNHVIIYPHWGTELVDVPDPKDVINARLFIDSGASAVIGHHPHIIQGIETYKHGVIAYSLGSFIYVPEKEVGYSKSQGTERNYSICLNIEFNQESILKFKPIFYNYDKEQHLPIEINDATIKSYFENLNETIFKKGVYASKVKKELLSREIKSFIHRFKSAPMKTVVHYFNYLKIDHFKKLLK